MASEDPLEEFRQQIKSQIPASAEVTKIEFEGPEIAIYARNPRSFGEQTAIKELAKQLRKRIVIRSDPDVRSPPEQAEEAIRKIVPEEAEITAVTFNDSIGEVVIEAKKPGLVIGRTGTTMEEIRLKTLWRPTVIRTPPLCSDTILKIRHALQSSSEDRKTLLRQIGRRIYRPLAVQTGYIRMTPLGGFREVGRMSMLLQTAESNVLIDCGVNVGAVENTFPRFDLPDFDVSALDALIITHAHLDHCLPPATPVRMADGRWKPIGEVQVGEAVSSLNWETGEFESAGIVGKTTTEGHHETVEIATPYLRITASPNHRFFVVEDLKVREIEAQDLREDMLIPVQRPSRRDSCDAIALTTTLRYHGRLPLSPQLRRELRSCRLKRGLTQKEVASAIGVLPNAISLIETTQDYVTLPVIRQLATLYELPWTKLTQRYKLLTLPETVTPELAQLVGYIQGDGHKSGNYSLRITEADHAVVQRYCDLIHQIFRFEPTVRLRKDTKTPTFTIEVNNAQILRFLQENFSTLLARSPEREVPFLLRDAPDSVTRAYLRGFFDAEASVARGVKFCSYSPQLLRQVQFLLYRLDIPASLHDKDHTLRVAMGLSLSHFAQTIGLSSPTKTEKLQNLLLSLQTRTNLERPSLVPLSSSDLTQILSNTGILGRVHDSPRITELPLAILDCHRRGHGYMTRRTVAKLLKVLKRRYETLESLKTLLPEDLLTVRQQLSIPRAIVAGATGLSLMQIQYREETALQDTAAEDITEFLAEQIDHMQDHISIVTEKIHYLLSLPVDWQRVTHIGRHPNSVPLVDIEVQPTRNFVANGIIAHNCGFAPFLYKYGYEGPVYCTPATQDLMTMLQVDYLEVAQREGKLAPYTLKDVRNLILHTIPLNYGEVTDIAPDVRLTLHNAGHILGSSIAHLHVGDGLYNLAYTGDFKYARSRLLEPAVDKFPRLETLIMESTYGAPNDLMPSRKNSERLLCDYINRAIKAGGKVLVPVLAVGRAQELLVVIDEYMQRKMLLEAPVYVDGMIIEATAIHTAHPEYLAHDLRDKIFHQGQNPFLAEYFTQVNGHEARSEILESGPCVILATSGMLTGGPSVQYFKELAHDPRNAIIFVSYQVEGTMGRRIQKGRRQLPFRSADSRSEVLQVDLQIHTVEGFSGHSDRRQLVDYTRRVQPKPERILTCHGEAAKCIGLASQLHREVGPRQRLETRSLQNFETVRLY